MSDEIDNCPSCVEAMAEEERGVMLHAMHDASKFAEGAAKAILEGQLHRFEYAGRASKQGEGCECDACVDQRTPWVPWES